MTQQLAFHPQLQEMEERLVPASYRWHPTPLPGGGFSSLWSVPSNWEGKSAFIPGWTSQSTSAPGTGDSVLFAGGGEYNLDCHVDAANGVTVNDVALSRAYTSQLVLDNPLTLSGGISTHDSAGGAIVGYSSGSTAARGVLNVTGRGTSLDWTGGHISDITVNVTNSATMFVSTLTFTRNMSGSDIYIGDTSILGWFSGPVNVTSPSANSNIFIAPGVIFSISANQTWGMTTPISPAYFAVHNAGIVKSTGTATIVGDYLTTGTTRLDSGSLHISGLAEQTAGVVDLRNDSTLKVSNPTSVPGVLGIRSGTIRGQGRVDGHLVLGNDPAVGPQLPTSALISPGYDSGPPATPGMPAPQSLVGTLTITGKFQMFNGSMAIDVLENGDYDNVIVQGEYAALSGGLVIHNSLAYKPFQTLNLAFLTATSFVGDFTDKYFTTTSWYDPATFSTYGWKFVKTATTYNFSSFVSKVMGPPNP